MTNTPILCQHCHRDIGNQTILYGRCPECGEQVLTADELCRLRGDLGQIPTRAGDLYTYRQLGFLRQVAADMSRITSLIAGEAYEGLPVREAARKRFALTGADAQALEGALQQVERENAELRAEMARLREERVCTH